MSDDTADFELPDDFDVDAFIKGGGDVIIDNRSIIEPLCPIEDQYEATRFYQAYTKAYLAADARHMGIQLAGQKELDTPEVRAWVDSLSEGEGITLEGIPEIVSAYVDYMGHHIVKFNEDVVRLVCEHSKRWIQLTVETGDDSDVFDQGGKLVSALVGYFSEASVNSVTVQGKELRFAPSANLVLRFVLAGIEEYVRHLSAFGHKEWADRLKAQAESEVMGIYDQKTSTDLMITQPLDSVQISLFNPIVQLFDPDSNVMPIDGKWHNVNIGPLGKMEQRASLPGGVDFTKLDQLVYDILNSYAADKTNIPDERGQYHVPLNQIVRTVFGLGENNNPSPNQRQAVVESLRRIMSALYDYKLHDVPANVTEKYGLTSDFWKNTTTQLITDMRIDETSTQGAIVTFSKPSPLWVVGHKVKQFTTVSSDAFMLPENVSATSLATTLNTQLLHRVAQMRGSHGAKMRSVITFQSLYKQCGIEPSGMGKGGRKVMTHTERRTAQKVREASEQILSKFIDDGLILDFVKVDASRALVGQGFSSHKPDAYVILTKTNSKSVVRDIKTPGIKIKGGRIVA